MFIFPLLIDFGIFQNKEEQAQAEERLKYLGFIHLAAMQALVCFTKLYVYARENSGPLKPGVHTMEGAVKTVIGPVYDKFHGVPYDLLKSVDQKVGPILHP